MLYKERKTRVMCDFYMLYINLENIIIILNTPPLRRTHTRMTPVRTCFIRLAMYAAWHAHKGLITLDRTVDRLDKVQTTVKANKT